jgi:hypothetical protein
MHPLLCRKLTSSSLTIRYLRALQWAKDVFERLFSTEVLVLLAEHPADEVDEDGQSFWGRYGANRGVRIVLFTARDR